MHKNSSTFSNFALVFTLIIMWGLSWPIMKMALQDAPPLWLSVLRLAIAAVCLFAFLFVKKKLVLPRWRDLPIILSIGIMQAGLFTAFVNIGLLYVAAGRSAILAYTTPLWVTPIAVFLFKEPLPWLKIVGLLFGLAGVFILFDPGSFDWHDHHVVLGNGLLILAAILWAICIIHARFGRWHLSTIQLLPWQMLVGTLVTLFAALYFERHDAVHWTPRLIGLLFYIGPVATALGFWMGLEASQRLPSVTLSLCMLGVPMFGLLSSHLLLHEPIYLNMIISMILIITGLVCVLNAKKIPLTRPTGTLSRAAGEGGER